MSDDSVRNDNDPSAQVAQELRARLRAMRGDELLELAAQLVTTYVIEGVVPLARAGESADLPADPVGDESFAQLLKRLKTTRKDPVLDRFLIDGENISVRIDGQGVMPLTEYRRPNQPPASAGQPQAAQQRRESVPGAATSIYNRGLYQPEQQPLAPRQSGAPAPVQRAPSQPAAPAPLQQQKPGAPKEEPKNDRFSLIELE